MVSDRAVVIGLGQPRVDELGGVVAALRKWQDDAAPFQLHPGDVGWFWRFGAEATAAAVRTWSRDGRIVAVGLLDGPSLLRLAIEPESQQDEALARRLVDDTSAVLPEGSVAAEVPPGALVDELLAEAGWIADEPWTPLRRDLTAPVADPGLRIEVVGGAQAEL